MICFGPIGPSRIGKKIREAGQVMKKTVGIVVVLVVLFGVFFMMMRRSHMMNAGSQVSAGGLVAVSATGAPLPAPAAAGQLPENTAAQTAGDLLVFLNIDPYPPTGGGPSTFTVKLTDASGQPVSDATLSLDLTMPEMWMPPNQVNLAAGEAGSYQASGYFTMRGLWRIEVILLRDGQKQSVFFEVGL
jgi:hypothetical protein